MYRPALTGDVFPGRPRAQTHRTPSAPALSKSTPPGSEATSMTSAPFFRADSSSTPSTGAGIVLMTRS